MRIKKYSETTLRHWTINGTQYESYRYSDKGGAYVEIMARKWTGWAWECIHYWYTGM